MFVPVFEACIHRTYDGAHIGKSVGVDRSVMLDAAQLACHQVAGRPMLANYNADKSVIWVQDAFDYRAIMDWLAMDEARSE